MTYVGLILMALSVVPLIFLMYSLFNLEKLNIGLAQPRVIVESMFFCLLMVVGLILWSIP
jgi:hypothetical protein